MRPTLPLALLLTACATPEQNATSVDALQADLDEALDRIEALEAELAKTGKRVGDLEGTEAPSGFAKGEVVAELDCVTVDPDGEGGLFPIWETDPPAVVPPVDVWLRAVIDLEGTAGLVSTEWSWQTEAGSTLAHCQAADFIGIPDEDRRRYVATWR